MEWTNELILEFLELYKKEPCIWNPKHPKYNNRCAVHVSWHNISKNLSQKLTIIELKKKKDSLMATFRKIENKMKSRKKTGSGLDIYKPHWFAYEFMAKFLREPHQLHATKYTEVKYIKNINNT